MIHVLTGTNSFMIQEKLRTIRADFIQHHGSEGVEVYESGQLTEHELINILSSTSLFSSSRLIVLKRLSENKLVAEKLIDQLNLISNDTILILVEGVIDRRTAYYKELKKLDGFSEFSELDEHALGRWVAERVTAAGGVIEPSTIRALIATTGNDQQRLSHEIQKLVSYQSTITPESVKLLIEPNQEDNVFALLEAALGGRRAQALKLLEDLERSHQDPFQLVNMLIWQVHIMAIVASSAKTSDKEVSSDMKLNPFVVGKTRRLVSGIGKQKLRGIIDATALLDISLKTGSSEPWPLLGQTIIAFNQ